MPEKRIKRGKLVQHESGFMQLRCPFCGFDCNIEFIYPCDCGVEFYKDARGRWWFDKDRKTQASENSLWARVLRNMTIGKPILTDQERQLKDLDYQIRAAAADHRSLAPGPVKLQAAKHLQELCDQAERLKDL